MTQKVAQVKDLESNFEAIQQGLAMRLLRKYRRNVDLVFPLGTRRRQGYTLALKGTRIVLSEGWRSFFRRAKNRITGKLVRSRQVDTLPHLDTSGSAVKMAGKLSFPKPSIKPDVSIIIPVYNKWQYTINCLKSISDNTKGDYEVIVVDDCSSDQTAKQLSKVNNLCLIKNDKNLGFIGSCNRGAKESRGKYILFLNNDTMVTDNWLPPLVKVIEKEKM